MTMTRWGFWIALFGVLYWVLPKLGVQHIAFAWLGKAAEPTAIGLVVVGGLLLGLGLLRRKPSSSAPPK